MRIRKLINCTEIIAGDKTILRELLHPDREYAFAGRYSLAHAKLPIGAESDKHKLKTDEVYYILEGRGEMFIDKESEVVEKGDTIEIPPDSMQYIRNIGDCELEFLCIVDPAWRPEDEEIL